ncbi:MAG: hypothetical protein HKN04_04560 [Rhodothermaceae bacterium]|nr:hypothetical protein [Rhodothermaceae bacterium]
MLTAIAVLLFLLALSLRWVWHDAQQRGHDPRLALTIALLCWPAGLSLWLMVRSPHQLAPPGMGSAWG